MHAYLQQLDDAVGLASSPRFLKLLSQPYRLGRSKMLELIALGKPGGIPSLAKTFWNESMHIVLPERVSLALFRYGFFEAELTRALIQLVRPGMVFFDIGAHIGYFSLLASELVGTQGQVHSFEPTSTSFSILRRNTETKSNVTLVNAAVYSKEGALQLQDFGVAYSAFNSIYAGKMRRAERRKLHAQKYTAQAVTLAQYVATTEVKPDVIKIDAEGAELSILAGLESALATVRPILTVEVGDTVDSSDVPRSRPVIAWLMAHDYQPTEFVAGEFVPHQPRDVYQYTNLTCFPR